MRPLRTLASVSVLLLASAVVAPSVGAYTEAVRTGTAWGDPITVQDYNNLAGVKCKYENNPGKKHDELDKIRIRSQFFHGPYLEKSYVGYRIIIKRNKPPLGDGTYKKFIVSKIIKKLASDSDIANFKARVFKVPEGTNARYRAHIKLYWYAKGSKTDVRGMTRGILDVYDHKMKPKPVYKVGSEGAAGYCNRNWHNGAP